MKRDFPSRLSIASLAWLAECAALPYLAVAEERPAQIAAAKDVSVDYLTQVKPLLRERCYACHGALKQEADLRLDTVDLILKGGNSGPAIDKAGADSSMLLSRVTAADVAERMPPEHEGEPFTAEQVALLRNWIASGASAPDDEQPEADPAEHWAFKKPRRPEVPKIRGTEYRIQNEIDAFIAAELEKHNLQSVGEADKSTLLRRVYLDLIGLPPTRSELHAFLVDDSPDAYDKVVDRLLASPQYGERWARHWMDIWRYSDWWGLDGQLLNSQKHIWHWRDWIVESLNADLPYDEMVRLMLAADELHPNDLDKLRATGYLARNYYLFNRNQWMDETVEHVSKGFLGLTMNCAKCHDHKYDPISQVDYYKMRAFFEPYHIRMEMLPGEPDLAINGIPRAFDALLEAPTHRFIRGEESNPDNSLPISPGVLEILEVPLPDIKAVDLPVEAWRPERRSWIAETYRARARQQLALAEGKLESARAKLAALQPESEIAAAADGKTIIEKFAPDHASPWQRFGGEWSQKISGIELTRDGLARSALRLQTNVPRDFEARLKISIHGGSLYRSVGISFDSTQWDPERNVDDDDSEQFVYVSAFVEGPKVQAAWHRGGTWQYPAEGMVDRPIELNREYTLHIQVRDTLINVFLDGTPVLAWRSPLARRDDGSFQISTYDALVTIHEVAIAPLNPHVVLREPAGNVGSSATMVGKLDEVWAECHVAECTLEASQAHLHSIEQRISAMQAHAKKIDHEEHPGDQRADPELVASERKLAMAAARAEKALAAAQAKLTLAETELRLLLAGTGEREAVANEVASARETLAKSLQQIEQAGEHYTQLQGAQWSATRFNISVKDDPMPAFPPRSSGRRKALAAWMTDPANPLTSRVAVNHLWARHFGTPLVATVFDFGRKGRPPSHPELLNWLAAELIDSGWSMGCLHRLMVLSATYRLASTTANAEGNLIKDRDNRFLWRRTPARLESQVVRDMILSLSGKLDLTRGGPPVPPDLQENSTRRSLYLFHSNTHRNLFLTMFDEALVNECYRREQSIVPQQALALTNSRLVLEAAPAIAKQLTSQLAANDSADDDSAFVRLAFALLLGIEPSEAEVAASIQAIQTWKQLPNASQDDSGNQLARANLVWVLLNHSDFVTSR